MHNPYAKAGGFQNEAPELKLADGLDLKSAFAKQHMTAKAVLGKAIFPFCSDAACRP